MYGINITESNEKVNGTRFLRYSHFNQWKKYKLKHFPFNFRYFEIEKKITYKRKLSLFFFFPYMTGNFFFFNFSKVNSICRVELIFLKRNEQLLHFRWFFPEIGEEKTLKNIADKKQYRCKKKKESCFWRQSKDALDLLISLKRYRIKKKNNNNNDRA